MDDNVPAGIVHLLDILSVKVSAIRANVATSRAETAELRNEMNLGFGRVERRLSSLETRVEAVEAQVSVLGTKIDRLALRVSALNAKIDRIETQVSVLCTKLDTFGQRFRHRSCERRSELQFTP